jgi:hypothetical protein
MSDKTCPLCNSPDIASDYPDVFAWYVEPTVARSENIYACCVHCREYTQIWAASRCHRYVYTFGHIGDPVPQPREGEGLVMNAIVAGMAITTDNAELKV